MSPSLYDAASSLQALGRAVEPKHREDIAVISSALGDLSDRLDAFQHIIRAIAQKTPITAEDINAAAQPSPRPSQAALAQARYGQTSDRMRRHVEMILN